MEKVGPDDKPEWKPKYTLRQLLDPEFRLPTDDEFTDDDLMELGNVHGFHYDEVR